MMPEYCTKCGGIDANWAIVARAERPGFAWPPSTEGLIECAYCHAFVRWLGPGELTNRRPAAHDELPQRIVDSIDAIIPGRKFMTKEEQIAELQKGLNPAVVKKNPSGKSYIEGFYAVSELNRIFGHGGWDSHVENIDVKDYTRPGKDGKEATCASAVATVRLDIRFADGTVIVRTGVGAGDGINYSGDIAGAREGAAKEAETDGLKRAAKSLGPPFGLSLYDKHNPLHGGGVDIWEGDGPVQRAAAASDPPPVQQAQQPQQAAPPASRQPHPKDQIPLSQRILGACIAIFELNGVHKVRIDAILAKHGNGTPQGVRPAEEAACLGALGQLYLEAKGPGQRAA